MNPPMRWAFDWQSLLRGAADLQKKELNPKTAFRGRSPLERTPPLHLARLAETLIIKQWRVGFMNRSFRVHRKSALNHTILRDD